MSKQPNYFWIGLFVLGVLGLIIGGIVMVSADSMGVDAILMETYLDESVMGLSVGSELSHRGVPIGRIERITFVATVYEMAVGSRDLERFGRYVLVVVAVDPKRVPTLGDDPEKFRLMMEEQVRQGLRLKLSYQGITGLAVLETDYVTVDRTTDLEINWEPKNIYIPSTPSLITSFTQAVDNVFQRLEKIDFEAVVNNINGNLTTLEKTLKDIRMDEVRQTLVTFVGDLSATNQQLKKLLVKTEHLADNDIAQALQEFSMTLRRIERLVAFHEPDVDQILVDVRLIAANLKQLSESLKADPAKLLLSTPPERSEVVK
jgi:ABC-type transporter Mla subunit MlaD